jgi:hypothetical protein
MGGPDRLPGLQEWLEGLVSPLAYFAIAGEPPPPPSPVPDEPASSEPLDAAPPAEPPRIGDRDEHPPDWIGELPPLNAY